MKIEVEICKAKGKKNDGKYGRGLEIGIAPSISTFTIKKDGENVKNIDIFSLKVLSSVKQDT